MSDKSESPTWEELDAIRLSKSPIDLAEEIWRVRRELAEANDAAARWYTAAVPYSTPSALYDALRASRPETAKPVEIGYFLKNEYGVVSAHVPDLQMLKVGQTRVCAMDQGPDYQDIAKLQSMNNGGQK